MSHIPVPIFVHLIQYKTTRIDFNMHKVCRSRVAIVKKPIKILYAQQLFIKTNKTSNRHAEGGVASMLNMTMKELPGWCRTTLVLYRRRRQFDCMRCHLGNVLLDLRRQTIPINVRRWRETSWHSNLKTIFHPMNISTLFALLLVLCRCGCHAAAVSNNEPELYSGCVVCVCLSCVRIWVYVWSCLPS